MQVRFQKHFMRVDYKGSIFLLLMWTISKVRLPRWLSGKESVCRCRRCRGHRFDPWVGKIPWRREWPWTEEPGGLVTKSQTLLSTHTHTRLLNVSVKFVTALLLFDVLAFWPHGMWDLSSPTRNQLSPFALKGEVLTTVPPGSLVGLF